MKKKNFLTTGEFAKLCKTTKETLFHYDREELLKPKYVSENGYRYYGMEQFFDFDMIAMLKETGSSLKEVRNCMLDMDAGNFLSLLEKKRLAVKNERERLARREMTLRDLADGTREALDFPYGVFLVERQEEERLETLPTAPILDESVTEFVERFVEYIDFYGKQGRTPRYPYGSILDPEGVKRGEYLECYFFSRATRATPRVQLHVKPEGTYAVFAHKGSMQSHLGVFGDLLERVRTEGFAATGEAYVYDMMSYLLQGAGESYSAKYCVRVE